MYLPKCACIDLIAKDSFMDSCETTNLCWTNVMCVITRAVQWIIMHAPSCCGVCAGLAYVDITLSQICQGSFAATGDIETVWAIVPVSMKRTPRVLRVYTSYASTRNWYDTQNKTKQNIINIMINKINRILNTPYPFGQNPLSSWQGGICQPWPWPPSISRSLLSYH